MVFMAYRNSLPAGALKLVANKLQSSLAVEGELPEGGLAAYGDDGGDGDNLMLALARKIVNGEEGEAETVVFSVNYICRSGRRRLEGCRARAGRRRNALQRYRRGSRCGHVQPQWRC